MTSTPKKTNAIDSKWLTTFRRNLRRWYAKNHRQLPWRETRDPYAIWVSEIMLQQTQVATVIDYYHRFLKQFPTVKKLAVADEQAVLSMWSGLGYYRRAKQLHAAAKVVYEQHQGVFPTKFEDVLALPGIGRYTAGAITSFAYGQSQPILEANTIRLHSRLLGLQEDPTKKESQTQLWNFAEQILPTQAQKSREKGTPNPASELNQAVMELGSLVCRPESPKCEDCPVSRICISFSQGIQSEIPKKKAKQKFVAQTHLMLLILHRGRWLMRQNPPDGWWAGLWDFPRLRISTGLSEADAKQIGAIKSLNKLEEEIQSELGIDCTLVEYLKTIRHGVTKYRITLHCISATTTASDRKRIPDGWKWASLEEAVDLPLTSTSQKVLAGLGQPK